MNRSYNTLFLIQSVDGKINFSADDNLDIDKHSKYIPEYHRGRFQYKDLEQQTDSVSMNSGKVMAKIGVNSRDDQPTKMNVDFIIIDNKPHLTQKGINYLLKWVNHLYLVTSNISHPAYLQKNNKNLTIISYSDHIDFENLFQLLYEEYNIERITIQSGGNLNATLIRNGLIDELSIVISPILIGGKETPTIFDGKSLSTISDLQKVSTLKLLKFTELDHSFIHVQYQIDNSNEM